MIDNLSIAERVCIHSIIYLNISKELSTITGIEDFHLAWKALENHFRPSIYDRILELTDSLFEYASNDNCKLERT